MWQNLQVSTFKDNFFLLIIHQLPNLVAFLSEASSQNLVSTSLFPVLGASHLSVNWQGKDCGFSSLSLKCLSQRHLHTCLLPQTCGYFEAFCRCFSFQFVDPLFGEKDSTRNVFFFMGDTSIKSSEIHISKKTEKDGKTLIPSWNPGKARFNHFGGCYKGLPVTNEFIYIMVYNHI